MKRDGGMQKSDLVFHFGVGSVFVVGEELVWRATVVVG